MEIKNSEELKNFETINSFFDKTICALRFGEKYILGLKEAVITSVDKIKQFQDKMNSLFNIEKTKMDPLLTKKLRVMFALIDNFIMAFEGFGNCLGEFEGVEKEIDEQRHIVKIPRKDTEDAKKDLLEKFVLIKKKKENFLSNANAAEDAVIEYQIALKNLKQQPKYKNMTLEELKDTDKMKQLSKNKTQLLNKMEVSEGSYRAAVVKYNGFVKEFSIRVEPSINTLLFANKSLASQLNTMVANLCPLLSNFSKLVQSEIDSLRGGNNFITLIDSTQFEDDYGAKIEKNLKQGKNLQPIQTETYHIKILNIIKKENKDKDKDKDKGTIEIDSKYNNKERNREKEKSKDKEGKGSKHKYNFSVEDIHEIVKQIYKHLRTSNSKDYDLENEEKKIITNKLCQQILTNQEANPDIDEVNQLKKLFEEENFRFSFLQQLNEMRVKGIFKIPKKNIELIGELIYEILDKVLTYSDFYSAKNVIILSQTFFYEKNKGEKVYLLKTILDHFIFKNKDFWVQFLEYSIELEFKGLNIKLLHQETPQEAMNHTSNIVFSQLVPITDNMLEFGVQKDEIKEIIDPFLAKYQLSKEYEEMIYGVLNRGTK